jgi:hypothetical protein
MVLYFGAEVNGSNAVFKIQKKGVRLSKGVKKQCVL